MPYDTVLKEYGGIIPSEIYQHVYQMECATEDPEKIFEQFNLFHSSQFSPCFHSAILDFVEYRLHKFFCHAYAW